MEEEEGQKGKGDYKIENWKRGKIRLPPALLSIDKRGDKREKNKEVIKRKERGPQKREGRRGLAQIGC